MAGGPRRGQRHRERHRRETTGVIKHGVDLQDRGRRQQNRHRPAPPYQDKSCDRQHEAVGKRIRVGTLLRPHLDRHHRRNRFTIAVLPRVLRHHPPPLAASASRRRRLRSILPGHEVCLTIKRCRFPALMPGFQDHQLAVAGTGCAVTAPLVITASVPATQIATRPNASAWPQLESVLGLAQVAGWPVFARQ
jgi:hypothetical protein